ncbi:IRS-type PTB domain-containing protein [Caerostris extrusa]|uniref:IRS-type PTB domain-containing protein n=1 Tax=Caerostris extrusa TaxID=172846 RepID=A0AAV4MSR6_CAEEX|nr:IRS-type PTB domain-containing protein [Caerostris extrusa]
MSGDLQLAIFSHGVGLAKPGMASCFVVWPVAYIRQYLHESTGSTGRTKTTIVSLETFGDRGRYFQFRTQKGAEIIRELKGIVELWSARKAVLSIQQSSAKHDIFRNSPSKMPHSRGARGTSLVNSMISNLNFSEKEY